MADTTTYAKMQDIVAAVRSMRHCTMDDLTKELGNNAVLGKNSFVYYRRNENGKIETLVCTDATMRKHVRFCQELGFLTGNTDFSLTDLARKARATANYDAMLESQLIEYLDANKITMADIESAIKKEKTSDPETIFRSLPDKSLSEDRFRSCLNLLSIAGKLLIPYQKKMYLIHAQLTANTEH